MLIKRLLCALTLGLSTAPLFAADYKIDPAHSFLIFRIQHLNVSWTYGRFGKLGGEFTHDPANPSLNRISVKIDPASVDTNYAERDKAVREKFLKVNDFPQASFESVKYTGGDDEGVMEGTLTLLGTSKPIAIDVRKVAEGPDPWGGYRAGFSGATSLSLGDWGIPAPGADDTMEFEITIEGVRQ